MLSTGSEAAGPEGRNRPNLGPRDIQAATRAAVMAAATVCELEEAAAGFGADPGCLGLAVDTVRLCS